MLLETIAAIRSGVKPEQPEKPVGLEVTLTGLIQQKLKLNLLQLWAYANLNSRFDLNN